ncbi:MAG TPA: hypothetical protein VIT38_11295 [Allosphingosinicella sp.]
MGRALLIAGGVVLGATAVIHSTGTAMVDHWTVAMDEQPRAALRLVWLTDSFDWAVVAAGWLVAAWRPGTAWRYAAALLALIPLAGAIGILRIEPTFFGGHLVLASVIMALAGVGLCGESSDTPRDGPGG